MKWAHVLALKAEPYYHSSKICIFKVFSKSDVQNQLLKFLKRHQTSRPYSKYTHSKPPRIGSSFTGDCDPQSPWRQKPSYLKPKRAHDTWGLFQESTPWRDLYFLFKRAIAIQQNHTAACTWTNTKVTPSFPTLGFNSYVRPSNQKPSGWKSKIRAN